MTAARSESYWQRRAQELEADNARLRNRVRDLANATFGDFIPHFELPRRQLQILQCLMQHDYCAPQSLSQAVYSDDYEGASAEPSVTIYSHVSKLRKRLMLYGVALHSTRRASYWIDAADKAKLRHWAELRAREGAAAVVCPVVAVA